MSDPLDNLPADVRAAVDRFNAARSRVSMAMLNTPLLAHQVNERGRLLADLKVVSDFVAAIGVVHSERSVNER